MPAVLIPIWLTLSACATHRAPVLVAQSADALVGSIGAISAAIDQIQQSSPMLLPPAVNLRIQGQLLAMNTRLKPVPDLLRAIDHAQQAGASVEEPVLKVLAILQSLTVDLAALLPGVPVGPATDSAVKLVQAAQQTVTTVLIEVARLRGQ